MISLPPEKSEKEGDSASTIRALFRGPTEISGAKRKNGEEGENTNTKKLYAQVQAEIAWWDMASRGELGGGEPRRITGLGALRKKKSKKRGKTAERKVFKKRQRRRSRGMRHHEPPIGQRNRKPKKT